MIHQNTAFLVHAEPRKRVCVCCSPPLGELTETALPEIHSLDLRGHFKVGERELKGKEGREKGRKKTSPSPK